MTVRQRLLVVVGTRPEAIKMAPVILRARAEPELFEVVVCATAQHRELADDVFSVFGIRPEIDLDLMKASQTPNAVAAGVFAAFDGLLETVRPDRVLVQGDTTSVMAASLASFHRGVRVAHVEAGLRTSDLKNPFPEEMNRRVTDLAADMHFAPTRRAAEALRREGAASIHVTGNTVVDALHWIRDRLAAPDPAGDGLVLVTSHRRENFGEPMRSAFRGIARLARRFPTIRFVFPAHPNPEVVDAVAALKGIGNVEIRPPAGYPQLVAWIRSARLILTDSGGIQEEAPAFGVPTLVLRTTTERPEGIEAGVARLVGTDEERIFSEGERLLADDEAHRAMARVENPYGDGKAAERIVGILAGRRVEDFAPRP
ncbi:MAG: non-hydrolyzing UDP-N-acetylglucosamine 2-epimerase [Thermoanaerobaculia bacterium]